MLKRIKADFRKQWISWTGFIGLIILGPATLITNPGQVIMVILGWILIVWGISIGAAVDKAQGYPTEEEMNKPYV